MLSAPLSRVLGPPLALRECAFVHYVPGLKACTADASTSTQMHRAPRPDMPHTHNCRLAAAQTKRVVCFLASVANLLSSLLPAGTHQIVFARKNKKKCAITLTFSLQCSMPHDTTHQPPFLYLAKPLLPTVVAWCHVLCGFCQVCVLLPFSHRSCKSVLLWQLSTSV